MNYKNIYYTFMEYCKTSTPRDRLIKRDPNDSRINSDYMYTERHHITPRHIGGTDDPDNMVVLLPEEHYFAHLVRWKAYNDRCDFLAVRFIVNGLNSVIDRSTRHNNMTDEEVDSILHGSIGKKIGRWRQYIQEFRKHHGWQTECGRSRISKARQGTMPCVDSKTRVSVGSHPVDHPNILSGKWVHQSKGTVVMKCRETGNRVIMPAGTQECDKYELCRADVTGDKNPNFKPLTEEIKSIIIERIPYSTHGDVFIFKRFVEDVAPRVSKLLNTKISRVYFTNKFNGIIGLVEWYNKETNNNVVYETYYRAQSKINRNKSFRKYD